MRRKDRGGSTPRLEQKSESALNAALRELEATEANVEKVERILDEIRSLTPSGIAFGSDGKYEDRVRAYEDVVSALPLIDGWKPKAIPMALNSIGQARLDAKECGEISAEIAVEEEIEAPEREVAEYRYKLNRTRRKLIRTGMLQLVEEVDASLHKLRRIDEDTTPAEHPSWTMLQTAVQSIDTLLGSAIKRPPRWSDLRRHLSFAERQDLADIIRLDWPEVKSGLTKNLYGDDEPIPVTVADLGTLSAAQPTGPVVTQLKWESLTDEDFERLVFSLISSSSGYENPEWLTRTNAPDRGRDLSVSRVIIDPLSGTIRSRVLIQCRHWLSKSVAASDVATLIQQMRLWEPPRVDVLIIATSGRFTTDAVQTIETHNNSDRALRIEMWPEAHIERLLAERPHLIAQFGLR